MQLPESKMKRCPPERSEGSASILARDANARGDLSLSPQEAVRKSTTGVILRSGSDEGSRPMPHQTHA